MTKELWIALVNIVASLIVYFTVKYFAPHIADDVKFVIGLLQPFVLAVIARFYAAELAKRIVAQLRR